MCVMYFFFFSETQFSILLRLYPELKSLDSVYVCMWVCVYIYIYIYIYNQFYLIQKGIKAMFHSLRPLIWYAPENQGHPR